MKFDNKHNSNLVYSYWSAQNVFPALEVSLRWQMENLAIGPPFMMKRFRLNVVMSKQILFYFNFICICISITIIFTFHEIELWSFCSFLLLQLSWYHSVCLSLHVCLSACLFFFVCPSMSVCLSLSVYKCLSVYVCLSLFHYLFPSVSVCLSLCVSIHWFVSVYLSLSVSVCLSAFVFNHCSRLDPILTLDKVCRVLGWFAIYIIRCLLTYWYSMFVFVYCGYSLPEYTADFPYYLWLLFFKGGCVLVPQYIHTYTTPLCLHFTTEYSNWDPVGAFCDN